MGGRDDNKDMTQTPDLTGCALCGEDYLEGDAIRAWESLRGTVSCHDECYHALHTDPKKLAQKLPKITAASVTYYTKETAQ